MTTCSYAHIALSGFLSSSGVIALILLKFEVFIPSSAITTCNIWVTLRRTVGRLDFFHVDRSKDEVLVS